MKGKALAVSLCLLGTAGCRSENPAFRGTSPQEELQAGFSGLPHSGQGPTSAGHSQRPTSTGSGTSALSTKVETTLGQTQGVTSSGSTTRESTALSSSPSGSESPSAGILCSGREYLCYPMAAGSDASSYPAVQDSGPALGPMFQSEIQSAQDPQSLVFAEHVTIRDGARIKSNDSVKSGANSDFGFEISIRSASCDGPQLCIFAVVGNISLSLDLSGSTAKVVCTGYNGAGVQVAESSTWIDPAPENHVGCYAQGEALFLSVRGGFIEGNKQGTISRNTENTLRLGALNNGTDEGYFVGDIGRFRYWLDPEVMRLDILAK